uniref:Dual specificity protein phosphatase n=2 Tax=Lepeophtheirus salmonis TaxID=72036 RepID=A0A0K2U708_LEPSM
MSYNLYNEDGHKSLWNIVSDLKEVLATPVDLSNKQPPVLYDDSKRLVNMTEIMENLYIGDEGAAKNAFYLKKVGISHVLNTAEGTRNGLVDTNAKFYKPFGINYKGLKLLDVAQTNISMYFQEVSDYIDEALRNGGKVLVNCMMGMSRSSTCVLAYLMLRQNMTAVEALTEVRKHRDIRPNDGFLRQLADLDNKLRRERGLLK